MVLDVFKFLQRFSIFGILLILLASQTYALSVRPARITLDPASLTHKVTVCGGSSANILVSDEIKNIVLSDKDYVKLDGGCEEIELTLMKIIPGNILGSVYIVGDTIQAGALSSTIKIPLKVSVEVPYPSGYVESELSNLTVTMYSVGNESVDVRLDILINSQRPIMKKTYRYSLDAGEVFVERLPPPESPGKYFINLTLSFGDYSYTTSDYFIVGSPSVDIISYHSIIKSGEINDLNLRVKPAWNRPVNLTGRIELYLNDTLVSYTNIPFTRITSQKQSINAYVDARNLTNGNYTMKIFFDKINNHTFTIRLADEIPVQNNCFAWVILIIILSGVFFLYEIYTKPFNSKNN